MSKVAEVECPKCHKTFIVNYIMIGEPGIDFHCPWCDTYFKEQESPKIRK